MNTYLPYYFRKIGIVIVLISIVFSMIGGVNGAAREIVKHHNSNRFELPDLYPNNHVGDHKTEPLHYTDIISLKLSATMTWIGISLSFVGFLLYMFSKEKTEDELIKMLRYRSLEKSLIITWVLVFVFLIFKSNVLDVYSVLQFQLLAYVVIYLHHKEKYDIR